jgi:hypothetical protein
MNRSSAFTPEETAALTLIATHVVRAIVEQERKLLRMPQPELSQLLSRVTEVAVAEARRQLGI